MSAVPHTAALAPLHTAPITMALLRSAKQAGA